jgi:hypothetical protein
MKRRHALHRLLTLIAASCAAALAPTSTLALAQAP